MSKQLKSSPTLSVLSMAIPFVRDFHCVPIGGHIGSVIKEPNQGVCQARGRDLVMHSFEQPSISTSQVWHWSCQIRAQ